MAIVWILESRLSKVSAELGNMQKRRNELRSISAYIILEIKVIGQYSLTGLFQKMMMMKMMILSRI